MSGVLSDERFPVLLERHLKVQRNADDQMADVVVEIGAPYWVEPGIAAACPVAIRGDVGRVNDIHSVDLMGAMKEAILFVEAYLEYPAGDVKFYWPDGEPYGNDDSGAPTPVALS